MRHPLLSTKALRLLACPAAVAIATTIAFAACVDDDIATTDDAEPSALEVINQFKDVARVDPALPACGTSWMTTPCYNTSNPPAPSLLRELSNPWLKPLPDTSSHAPYDIRTEPPGGVNDAPRVLPFDQLTLDGRLAVVRQDNVDANSVGYLAALRLEALDADLTLKPGETQFQSREAQAAKLSALLLLNPVKTMVPELYRNSIDFPGDTIDSEFSNHDGFIGGVDLCESASAAYTLPAQRGRSPRPCTSQDAAPVQARCYNLTLLRGVTNEITHNDTGDAATREKWGFHELRSVEVMVAVAGMTVKIYPRWLRDGRDLWATATFPRFAAYEYGFDDFAFDESSIREMTARYVADAGSAALADPTVCYTRRVGADGAVSFQLNPASHKACDFWENQHYAAGFRLRRTHADRNDLLRYKGLLPPPIGAGADVGAYPVSGLPMVTATWDGRKRTRQVKQDGSWISAGEVEGFTLNQLRTDQPITAKDGRLLFLRLSGLFYAYAPPGKPACRANSFGVYKPLSGMPSDPDVNQRYDLARTGLDPATGSPRPYRNTRGEAIAFGKEDFADYAWVDPEAKNIFFTAHNGPANNDSYFATDYVSPGNTPASLSLPASFDPQSNMPVPRGLRPLIPHDRSATQTVVLGAWTHFKWVVLDNMLNAADFAGRKPRRAAYRLRLYADQDLTISPGDNQEFTSMANAGFLFAPLRPTLPFDVVWKFGTSSQHNAEVVFDPYLTNDMMVVAHMNAPLRDAGGFEGAVPANGFAKSGEVWQFKGGPLLQNAATGGFGAHDVALVPSGLELLGGARIEPVAQGGVLGKGLFLDGMNDRAVARFSNVASKRSFYLGMWIDWRTTRPGAVVEEVLYVFPDQRSVHLAKASTPGGMRSFLVIRSPGEPVATSLAADGTLPGSRDLALGQDIALGRFFHLGLVIDAQAVGLPVGSQRVTAYLNGNAMGSLLLASNAPQLGLMRSGGLPGAVRTFMLGAQPPAAGVAPRYALRAWIDEFVMMSLDGALRPNAAALPELICNGALGTLKRVGGVGGVRTCEQLALQGEPSLGEVPRQPTSPLCLAQVHRNPLGGAANACERARALGLPTLAADTARPNTTNSPFCLTCHSEGNPTPGLRRLGPLAPSGIPLYKDPRRQPSNPLPVWCGPRLDTWQSVAFFIPSDISPLAGAACSTVDQLWTQSAGLP